MPKQLKKDELGRLGKIQKTKTHPQPAKNHRSGNTGAEQPGCQASFRFSPSFKPSAGIAQGTEAGRVMLELKACTALLSAVIIHLVAVLGSKPDLLCTDKNNIYESQDALGARSLLFPSGTAPEHIPSHPLAGDQAALSSPPPQLRLQHHNNQDSEEPKKLILLSLCTSPLIPTH